MTIVFTAAIGCDRTPEGQAKAPRRIAFLELIQETDSFSTVPTTESNFQQHGLYFGKDVLPFARNGKDENTMLGGFVEAVDRLGGGSVELVPIFRANADAGGPVDRALYERLKKYTVDSLKLSGKLDGVYLSLHGAMGVLGMRDPEGDLIKAVRAALGDAIPIGVSYDMHANVTAEQARLATFIVGFKTTRHRDLHETGYRSGELLVKTVYGEIRPVMAFRKMRLLKGGGMCIDFLAPMLAIFGRMKDIEKENGVLSVSNFTVHLWLDDPELGWSTVAVTDGDLPFAGRLADELADLDWSVRDEKHDEGYSPSQAIKIARDAWLARRLGTAVFCDASDAVGAGAPGENTWILKSLLAEAPDLVSYVPLCDSESAGLAYDRNLHDTVTVTVGRKLEKIYNTSLTFTGELIHKSQSRLLGKTAILRDRGVHLILTELPDYTPRPALFHRPWPEPLEGRYRRGEKPFPVQVLLSFIQQEDRRRGHAGYHERGRLQAGLCENTKAHLPSG